jgi:hypothetical protein
LGGQFAPAKGGQFASATGGQFDPKLVVNLNWNQVVNFTVFSTKGIKEEKITWLKISMFFCVGFVIFFLNWWLLGLPIQEMACTAFLYPNVDWLAISAC